MDNGLNGRVGPVLGEIRKALHIKQDDFAKFLGCSASNLSLIEKGEREPTAVMLMQIRLKYGTSIDDIIDEVTEASHN